MEGSVGREERENDKAKRSRQKEQASLCVFFIKGVGCFSLVHSLSLSPHILLSLSLSLYLSCCLGCLSLLLFNLSLSSFPYGLVVVVLVVVGVCSSSSPIKGSGGAGWLICLLLLSFSLSLACMQNHRLSLTHSFCVHTHKYMRSHQPTRGRGGLFCCLSLSCLCSIQPYILSLSRLLASFLTHPHTHTLPHSLTHPLQRRYSSFFWLLVLIYIYLFYFFYVFSFFIKK